jgi:membrane associated rhomboid family serine protease
MFLEKRREFRFGIGHDGETRLRDLGVNHASLEARTGCLYHERYVNWLDKLERRIGFIAIPGLIRIVVAFTALVFVLVKLQPEFQDVLALDPVKIRQGEVWRLVTYIFLPSTFSFWWIVFALWFLWFIGDGLERAWGAFRVTLYFLVGMIGTTLAAFFFGSNFSNVMLTTALFFAFARFYPDEVIYVFFVLPMKIKWVAWALGAFVLFGFVVGSMSYRMATVAALSNYIIFFGPEFFHQARHRRNVAARRQRFEGSKRDETEPLHRCAICGATEVSDPNLDFRVARDGEEYCVPHLPQAVTPTA